MKSLWKYSAIAVVAAAGSYAQADVVATNTATGSELVLFVRDVSLGASPDRVYARGLGITVDNIVTQAGVSGAYSGPGQSLNYTLPTIGPDANLTAFLGGGSQFVWTVMAADTLGTQPFNQRYVTTTQTDLTVSGAPIPINSNVKSAWSQIAPMLNLDLNGVLPDAPGSSTVTNGLWGQSGTAYEGATQWFGGGIGNENTLGSAANLYVLTNSSTSNTALARVFAGLNVQLDIDGTLHAVAPVGEVPLPPALLLLGSAFAGLAGVSRRKKQNAVAA